MPDTSILSSTLYLSLSLLRLLLLRCGWLLSCCYYFLLIIGDKFHGPAACIGDGTSVGLRIAHTASSKLPIVPVAEAAAAAAAWINRHHHYHRTVYNNYDLKESLLSIRKAVPLIRKMSAIATSHPAIQEAPAAERNKDPIWNVLATRALPSVVKAGSDQPWTVLEIAAGSGTHMEYFIQQWVEGTGLPPSGGQQEVEPSIPPPALPSLRQWFATDLDTRSLESIRARRDRSALLQSMVPIQSIVPLTLTDSPQTDGIVQVSTTIRSASLLPMSATTAIDSRETTEEPSSSTSPPSYFLIPYRGEVDLIMAINMVHISPWSATIGLFQCAQRYLRPGTGILYLYGPYFYPNATIPATESNRRFDDSLRGRNPEWGVRNLQDVIRLGEEQYEMDCCDVVEMPANNLSILFRRRRRQSTNTDNPK